MRKQFVILLVVMLAVFAAIGCTDTEDQPVTDDIVGEEDYEGPVQGILDDENQVTITDDGFDPSELEISVGETVTWANEGSTPQSVVAADGTFDSGEIAEGESFSYTFDETGIYQFSSDQDPTFEGVITITESGETLQDDQSGNTTVVPADG